MSDIQTFDALLRTRFPVFLRKVFETLHPSTTYIESWHIEAIAHQLEQVRSGKVQRLITIMPPRATKSITVSVAWPAYLIGHNPSLQLMCVSYSQALSADFSRLFRQVLQTAWYQRTFPAVKITKDTETLLETSEGGRRFATSIGGPITGFGGSLIIIDDPLNGADALSESARKKVQDFYRNSLISRLNDPAKDAIILVMQRLHEDDLAGWLLESQPGRWTELCLPAIAEEDESIQIGNDRYHFRKKGDLLEPIRLSQSVLENRQTLMGSTNFSAQYQQSPVPAGGAMLKRAWIKSYTSPPDRSQGIVRQSWDTAMKDNDGADYSVCTTWLDVRGDHYLIDVMRQKLEFPDLVKRAIEQFNRHQPALVLVEDRASGISLIQHLRNVSGIPIKGCKPDKDKKVRFERGLPLFETSKVFFPENATWLADLLKELLSFPAGRFDDQVDSVSQYMGYTVEHGSQVQFSADFGWGYGDPTPGDIANRLVERPILRPPRP